MPITITHCPLTGRKLRDSEVYVIDDPFDGAPIGDEPAQTVLE